MPSTEEYIAAGLYDPDTDATTGRLDLLAWLDEQGFTIEEMADVCNTMRSVQSRVTDERCPVSA